MSSFADLIMDLCTPSSIWLATKSAHDDVQHCVTARVLGGRQSIRTIPKEANGKGTTG